MSVDACSLVGDTVNIVSLATPGGLRRRAHQIQGKSRQDYRPGCEDGKKSLGFLSITRTLRRFAPSRARYGSAGTFYILYIDTGPNR